MTGRARGALVTGLLLLVSLVAPNPVGAAASPLVVQSWSVAGDVSDPGAKSYYPQVAVSQDGTRATAVWYRNVGAKRVIESASAIISGNQATWGPVSTLSDQGLPLYPEVALSKDGTTAVAVWHFKTKIAVGVTWNIQAASASISGNTASWGTAQDISAPGGDATYAQVALSRDGKTAIAMWNRKAPGEVSYAQSATAAVDGNQSAWDGAVNASAPGADANYPQVAMSEDGTRATAVWTRKSAPDFWVQAASAEIGAGGTSWGPVAEVSARGVDQASSQVALSRDGSVGHALWSLPDGAGNFTVQSAAAAITGNTGTWAAPVDLSAGSTSAQYPQIRCAADGSRAWAVWDQGDGAEHVVQASTATMDLGAPSWTPATGLSDVAADLTMPQIAVSSDGLRATAVWSLAVAPDTIIQAASALMGADAQWGAVANLTTSGTAQNPQVGAASHGGAATAIWQGWSGLTRIIRSAAATIAIPPGVPGNVVAVPGDGQVSVSFEPPASDGGSPILGYQYSLDGGANWVPAGPSPAIITSLVNGTTYQVAIRAVNGVGPGAAATIAATPMGPALVPVFDQPIATATGFTVNMTNYDSRWTVTSAISSGTGSVASGAPVGSVLPLAVQGMGFSSSAGVTVSTARLGYHPGSATVAGTSLPDPLGPSQTLAALVQGRSGAVIVASGGTPIAASVERDNLTGTVTLAGPGWSLVIQAVDPAGKPIPLKSGTLVLVPGSYLLVSAQGFAPGTPLQVWLFSEPIQIGTAQVDSRGSLVHARIPVPSTSAGWHALQLNGYDASGSVRSTSLSVRVEPQVSARLAATHKRSRIKLTVKPFCRSAYQLRLQKLQVLTTGGSDERITASRWVTQPGRHRTSGTRTSTWGANLPRGTYRAVVFGACGRAGTTSGSITLAK